MINTAEANISSTAQAAMQISHKSRDILDGGAVIKYAYDFFLLIALVLALPIFLGGSYYIAKYVAYLLTFSFISYLAFYRDLRAIKYAAICATFFLLQFVLLNIRGMETGVFLRTVLSWLFVFAVFNMALAYLKSELRFEKLRTAIVYSGFIVSLVALGHWFYDNGKLFWFFEPESIYISSRARWPFVNANHLGNFLLFIIFLQFSRMADQFTNFKLALIDAMGKRGNWFNNLLTGKRSQSTVFLITFSALMFMTILLAIAASMSRGVWLGASIGFVAYILLGYFYGTPKAEPEIIKQRMLQPVMAFLILVVFIYFLNDYGQELIAGRIEYGLKYSLEDIRWTMYADTTAMIKDFPLFGVGLGQWRSAYPPYMDASLSGLNHTYLHSDPMQLLAEIGILGSAIILSLAAIIIKTTFSLLSHLGFEKCRALAGIFCGLLAGLTASLVEFPLRMPAIQVLLALNLAFFIYKSEELRTCSE